MEIILINVSDNTVYINDLGIELPVGGDIDLGSNFTDKDIIESDDLKTVMDGLLCEAHIDLNSYNHYQLMMILKKLSEYEHETLKTLTHNLSQQLFFETTKDLDNKTQLITYYSNSSKINKVREEEVLRDENGKASIITTKQYDGSDVVRTETQTMNRDINGKITSIDFSVS